MNIYDWKTVLESPRTLLYYNVYNGTIQGSIHPIDNAFRWAAWDVGKKQKVQRYVDGWALNVDAAKKLISIHITACNCIKERRAAAHR